MKLSKSRYCEGVTCIKKLWLSINKPEEKEELNEAVFETGTKVGELAKNLYGKFIDIEYDNDLSKMIDDTKKELDKDGDIIVTEASFDFNNNFCSVDILRRINNKYEINEVKSSTHVNDIYLDDISYQYYILSNLGYDVDKCNIVILNSDYVRHGDLELDKLFNIVDVTDIVLSKQKDVEQLIKYININMEGGEPDVLIDSCCKEPYDCPFFNYCTRKLDKPNVFDLAGMYFNKKCDFYKKRITKYEDLLNEKLNSKCREQIEYELNDLGDKINTKSIEDFMNTLDYPLYFLDFETYQEAIPSYDGINPYMQIPFQYSLHVKKSADSPLEHYEFLAEAGIDPRRSLAEQLVKDIPMDVCTVAYNMSFERTVIKNLAKLYPDLSEHLLNIRNNMKDLMIPFKDRDYYNKDMQGSYSIKYVLPALFPNDPELDYHNLPLIHKGDEASNAYATLHLKSKEEQESIRHGLLVYCELDTYAMVKIWEKLQDVINKSINH